jgi:hypothetical protein
LADRGDARARPGDVLHQGHARLRGQGAPRPAAGRVVPRLPGHARSRPAPAGRGSEGADAGRRRPGGPSLLTPRGEADGDGVRGRPGDLSRPRPRPHAGPGLAGGRRPPQCLAAPEPTSRCPCR